MISVGMVCFTMFCIAWWVTDVLRLYLILKCNNNRDTVMTAKEAMDYVKQFQQGTLN